MAWCHVVIQSPGPRLTKAPPVVGLFDALLPVASDGLQVVFLHLALPVLLCVTVSKIIHESTAMLSALFREKSKCTKIAPPSKGRCCTTAPSGEAPDCTSHEFCGLRKGFGLPTGLWKKGIPNIDRVQGPYSEMHWDLARGKNLNSPVLAFWWRQRRTLGC